MKKLFVYAVIALAIVSCGIAKKATNTTQADNGLGDHVAQTREQMFAEDPDADSPRAWAAYNGFENQRLEAFAATSARAYLANEVASLIETANELYSNNGNINNTSLERKTEGIKTGEGLDQDKVKAVSQELLRGSRIVMSDRYRQKDGTVTCYVAVEISVKSVLANIKNNKAIQEAVTPERKNQIDFNSKQYEESMQAAYQALKEAKAQ